MKLLIIFLLFSFCSYGQTTGYVLKNADGSVNVANGSITSAQLAGSIAASKLVGTDITTIGTIGTGVWQGTIIGSAYGGTGNGFFKVTGPTTAEKIFTFPDANATILYSGGALGTPSSGTLTNCTFPTLNQNTTGTANIAGGTAGAIVYQSGANTSTVLAATATANKMLLSGASAAPTWSTSTIPTSSGTAGNHLVSDGTNWAAVNERTNYTTFVVSGSNATTTGQSLVDITGLTSGTLSNSTTYEVEAMLYVTTSAVTTGTRYAIFAAGTGGAAVVSAVLTGTTTTNAGQVVTQSASGTAAGTFLTSSGSSGIVWIKGICTTRGSGTATISIQHLKVTSGTSTVNIGSWMKIRLLN